MTNNDRLLEKNLCRQLGTLACATAFLLSACTPSATKALSAPDATITSNEHSFRIVTVASGLEHPWGMTFLPDGDILVTERAGRLRLISEGHLDPQPITGLPDITAMGQGGLLDVAIHPRFSENRWVYVSYTRQDAGGSLGTEVTRGRLENHRFQRPELIFRALPKSRGGRHFGSRLLFDPQGYLYVTLGDRGDRPRAQDLRDHAGSIIRLHDDGSVPEDNPFVGKVRAKPEIFSYGNRNVQGIALQAGTGTIWAHEHGPQGGDELNIVTAGANYGWPVFTYGREYGTGSAIGESRNRPGMIEPLHYWVPSIAPSGMTFYTGEDFPGWKGNLFVGSLKFRQLVRLELNGNDVVHEERMLGGILGRIRAVTMGPDGYLYLLNDDPRGVVVRLEPTAS